jgi:hypothetical protein
MSNLLAIPDSVWEEHLDRLTLYASCKIARLYWRGCVPDPRDFALKAINTTLTTKNWNESRHPDLLDHLKSVVDTDIANDIRAMENVRRQVSDESSSVERVAEHSVADLFFDEEAGREFRQKVQAVVTGDDLALKILECIDNNISSNDEIALLHNISEEEVVNARRRLQRAVEPLRDKMQKRRKKK